MNLNGETSSVYMPGANERKCVDFFSHSRFQTQRACLGCESVFDSSHTERQTALCRNDGIKNKRLTATDSCLPPKHTPRLPCALYLSLSPSLSLSFSVCLSVCLSVLLSLLSLSSFVSLSSPLVVRGNGGDSSDKVGAVVNWQLSRRDI